MHALHESLEDALREIGSRCRMDRSLAYLLEGAGEDLSMPLILGIDMDAAACVGGVAGWVAKHGHPFYSIPRPERRQRNLALRAREVATERALATSAYNQSVQAVFDVGFPKYDQLRVLVCDGPVLLAWVGGFREGRFSVRNRDALQRLVPELRRRLALERRVRIANVRAAAFDLLLERLAEPTLIVNDAGRVEAANLAGRAYLDRGCDAFRARLRAAVRGGGDALLDVAPFEPPGLARHGLVTVRGLCCASDGQRVGASIKPWGLTSREQQVAALLAQGVTSKEIASVLGCALGTVHVHVGRILHKAGVDSRAKFAAKVWGA